MNATRLKVAVLLVGAVIAGLSCDRPSSLGSESLLGALAPVSGLFTCTPLPADSASATIGPAGGVLRVGPHTLSVPAGALTVPVTITAVAPSDTVNRVRFQPEGLTFQQPATLTLSYANCDLSGALLPKRIAYTTDGLEILSFLLSIDQPASQVVAGRLEHFSTYAVAW